MTIPSLTTANTFQEWINDTQQLIVLMNALTNGPQLNANTVLVLSTLSVANLIFSGTISGLNTANVPEATSNLYFTAARARANVSNTGVALLYDATTGIFSHANSAVVPSGYGDLVTIPVLIVDARGHVTSVVNTAIRVSSTSQTGIVQLNDTISSNLTSVAATANAVLTVATSAAAALSLATSAAANANVTVVARSGTFLSSRKTLNFIPGTNTTVTITDDSGNNQANITIDTTFGFGSNPITQKINGTVIAANTNTTNFLAGPGTNPVGVYSPAGSGEVQVTFYANGVYSQANAAYDAANVAILYASSNFSNTWFLMNRAMPTVVNDYVALGRFASSTNGVHSAIVSVQATGGYSALKSYVLNLANSSGPGVYEVLAPTAVQSANVLNDFEIDILRGPATIDIRLRRTAGTAPSSLDIKYVLLNSQLSSFDGFIANSNTGNDPTVTNILNTNWQANANNLLSGQIPDARLFSAAANPGVWGGSQIVSVVAVDSKGRVAGAANVAIDYSPARTQVSNTTPILYSSGTGVFSHAVSGVVAKTYGDTISIPVIAVDAFGHVTSVTNTTLRLASTSQFGAVQLDDTVTSTSSANAATANSVNTVNNLVRTIQAGLGTMSSQSNNNINVNGGKITSTLIDCVRLIEQVAVYTPGLNAGVTLDWGVAGGSNVIINGAHTVSFSNITAGVFGHILRTTNLAALTFAASANLDWGIGGLPSIAGEAVVTLTTINSGVKVYGGIQWRAV